MKDSDKILLVDDEEDIRSVLSMALEDMGYEVLAAENGREGLRHFKESRPSIVITDIKMPDIDGVDLLKRIKGVDPDVEVIMITGHGDMETAVQSFQNDATDFITKPINVDALESSLKKVRERMEARRQLRAYTETLESLVHEKSERLADLEKSAGKEGGSGALEVLDRFQGLFRDLPCHVAVIDEGLALAAVNSRFRQDFGDCEGELCYHVLKRADSPCSQCPVRDTFASGMSREGEGEITTRDGQKMEVLIWTAPVRTAGPAFSHVLALYTDMAQLQKVQDHLSSLGLMVGTISHSIKGMLTGLDGGMYMLDSGLRKENRDQIQEGLDIVKQMVARIRNMVLDVLLFSKDRDLKIEKAAVVNLARDAAAVAGPLAEQNGIAFEVDFPEDAGEFEVDRGLLRTALINVLENAVDACAEDTRKDDHAIAFRVKAGEDSVLFEIEDNGVGMDSETREKMCTLFFSSKARKGTGLGLYVTHRAVSRHGGSIDVDSEPGRGTLFVLRVPRRRPDRGELNQQAR